MYLQLIQVSKPFRSAHGNPTIYPYPFGRWAISTSLAATVVFFWYHLASLLKGMKSNGRVDHVSNRCEQTREKSRESVQPLQVEKG